jgi:hypothetical protein
MGITLGIEGCRVRFLLVSPLAPAGCLQLQLRPETAARVVGLAELFRKTSSLRRRQTVDISSASAAASLIARLARAVLARPASSPTSREVAGMFQTHPDAAIITRPGSVTSSVPSSCPRRRFARRIGLGRPPRRLHRAGSHPIRLLQLERATCAGPSDTTDNSKACSTPRR